jgi:hypothetical protein
MPLQPHAEGEIPNETPCVILGQDSQASASSDEMQPSSPEPEENGNLYDFGDSDSEG